MTALITSVMTHQFQGFAAEFAAEFSTIGLRVLLAGFPVVAVMSVLATLVVKPRMQAFVAA